MTPDRVVPDIDGKQRPLPCTKKGRPLDPVARSWWDGGFRCIGYVPPPKKNFKRYVRAVKRGEIR